VTTLALDHNFPQPIVAGLAEWLHEVRLSPIGLIDPRLTGLDDRRLLIALHQRGIDGLVTNNYKMLRNPYELAAVLKTKLAVFAIKGVGHDPIRAAGALLLDLPSLVKAVSAGRSGVFVLNPRSPRPHDPWALFQKVANQRREEVSSLYNQFRVTNEELNHPVPN